MKLLMGQDIQSKGVKISNLCGYSCTAWSMEFRYAYQYSGRRVIASLTNVDMLMFTLQPDGYLTEERKAADPDQGFSTFFSETGETSYRQLRCYTITSLIFCIQAKANMSHVLFTAIWSRMLWMKCGPEHTETFSTQSI